MPNVTFTRDTYPSFTFTFSKGREYPLHDPVKINVVTDYSEGKNIYCYDKGIQEQFFNLNYSGLSKLDYDYFVYWLTDIAVGSKNTFTYIDEDGIYHLVRLMDVENPLQEDNSGLYSGTIHLRQEI